MDRRAAVTRLLRSLMQLSDEGLYGSVEVKFVAGVPEMTIVKRQYKDGEMAMAPEDRLAEVLGPTVPSRPAEG